jgi:hypothetical protein
MIFFTTFVTLIRLQQVGTQRRVGVLARVEGNTIRLPIGTDVQLDDYIEHRLGDDEPRTMVVIDVIYPHMPGASSVDDHIEVTCIPSERAVPDFTAPVLHPTMSAALALVEHGRVSEAIAEAIRLVEERVQYLAASDESGHKLMESVFGAMPPKLDIATTTGPLAQTEREGFRLLFVGAMLGLRDPFPAGRAVRATVHKATVHKATVHEATVHETLEYLAFASMLMRRLDRAEGKLG